FASLPDLPAGEGVALVHLGTWQTTSWLFPPVSKLSSSCLSTKQLRGDERVEKFHISMAFSLRMRSAANCTRYSFAFSLFLFAGQSWQSSLFHQLLLLDLELRPA